MKIQIHAPEAPDITIPIPNTMLFSPTLLGWGRKIGNRYTKDTMPEIPAETVKQFCNALKQYRKTHGPWELLYVESGDCSVTITI